MKFTSNFNSFFALLKNLILILIALFMVNQVKSQTNYIEVGKKYSVVKLCLNNYKFIKAKNFTLINDSTISFDNHESDIHEVLQVKNVKFLSEKNGTYALTYGLVGAGIGFFSVLLTQVQNTDIDSEWGTMYIGFTVGCAAIGTLVGACIPKWRRLQFKDSSASYSFRFSPNANNYYYGLSLVVNF